MRIGLDIGSTTLKAIAIDEQDKPLFTYYERHNADVTGRMEHCFGQLRQTVGEDISMMVYEQLIAFKRSAMELGLRDSDVEKIMYGNAKLLTGSVK